MPERINNQRFSDLMDLVDVLRGVGGCPWDRKQTPETMVRYLLEEVHELQAAIEEGSPDSVCEELGDVVFQVAFLIVLFRDAGFFSPEAVIGRIVEKMIRRHPHVFGDATAETADAVMTQWRQIKSEEQADKQPNSVLDGVPKGLPALIRAHRVSERVAGVGFDWEELSGVTDKVIEEWHEFQESLENGNPEAQLLEFGDLLFTLTNIARFTGIDPEAALHAATSKFERRYREMEGQLTRCKEQLAALTVEEKEARWQAAKRVVDLKR
ncbi:MAG: nucleoside triphosphate pyrophosphohydrolase [Deltaproteobacteria bacterium]|nr:MAG: nucleoside triphosphate pyrophosphohydrolase [Deltaproteobacteria bacterium]